jgi:NTE family protein
MENYNYRLGLALSGGGYRATAFHLGTLKKLQELNLLDQVDVLSTISGGSITGAYYALNAKDFPAFEASLNKKLQTKNVITRLLVSRTGILLILIGLILLGSFYLLFTALPWTFAVLWIVVLLVIFKFQFIILPISKRIEEIYDRFYYKKATLGDLPARPVLVIGSTNLQTARPFSFSKSWMADSTYTYMKPPIIFKPERFPVARAVMASSCVPFAFTPVKIDRAFFADSSDAQRVHPALVDGGVYDNQGVHKIMQQGKYACATVIVSDAGAGGSGELTFRNTFQLLLETVNVFMARIKKVQMMQDIYNNVGGANKQIAYLSLGWDVENCIPGFVDNLKAGNIVQSVITALQLQPDWVSDPEKYREEICKYLEQRLDYAGIDQPTDEEKHIARKVGTNLTALSERQVNCLVKQAMALTELQVKLYCPSLLQNRTNG